MQEQAQTLDHTVAQFKLDASSTPRAVTPPKKPVVVTSTAAKPVARAKSAAGKATRTGTSAQPVAVGQDWETF
jgi:hypothetical protein